MVVGIHWENVSDRRIDLDLSLLSPETGKIGWDGHYRSGSQDILFSGDITDAPPPHGASELFYISQQVRGAFIMFVNYFNLAPDTTVPFKILVAQPVDPTTHYTVDPNTIVLQSTSTINCQQKSLGIIIADETGCRFYFAESNLGNSRSTSHRKDVEQARKYLQHFYTNTIILNDLLLAAGAELVNSASEADIDLSPETITKASILNLLSKQDSSL